MELFKCDICDATYFTDAHEGFNCDHCPGKLVKIPDEDRLYLPGNFMPDVEHPCISC